MLPRIPLARPQATELVVYDKRNDTALVIGRWESCWEQIPMPRLEDPYYVLIHSESWRPELVPHMQYVHLQVKGQVKGAPHHPTAQNVADMFSVPAERVVVGWYREELEATGYFTDTPQRKRLLGLLQRNLPDAWPKPREAANASIPFNGLAEKLQQVFGTSQ